jgi:hypothetical protein
MQARVRGTTASGRGQEAIIGRVPSFALVAAVDEALMEDVRFQLRTVPPFDLPLQGVDGHQAFLGAEHAAFVFWGSDPEAALVRVSGRADVRERVAHAIGGLHALRKLEPTFEWQRQGDGVSAPERAVAIIARGVDGNPDAASAGGAELVEALGGDLQRLRIFTGDGTGLTVVERTVADAERGKVLPRQLLADTAPLSPLRPLETLSETYWFESGAQLAPGLADGILQD